MVSNIFSEAGVVYHNIFPQTVWTHLGVLSSHRDPAQRDQGMFFTPNVVVCSGGFRLPGEAKP